MATKAIREKTSVRKTRNSSPRKAPITKEAKTKVKKVPAHKTLPQKATVFQKKRLRIVFPKIPKISKDIVLLIIPICFLIILLSINILNASIRERIADTRLPNEAVRISVAPYPMLIQNYTPYLSASAAIIMDQDTKSVLFGKNIDLRFSTASTTKIMTAYTALQYYKLDDILTIYRDNVEGSVAGLKKGDTFTFEDVLYAMLLPSGNDAAFTIGDNYPGGVETFVSKMNENARRLGLKDTHFSDPAGLDDDGNYTTAWDLAYLTTQAIQNAEIAKVTGTKYKTIANIGNTHIIPMENLNKLLGTNGVVGVKTGYTEGAGGVLVTAKEEKGHKFIIVVMKSIDRFLDTEALLPLISNNITYFSPVRTFP